MTIIEESIYRKNFIEREPSFFPHTNWEEIEKLGIAGETAKQVLFFDFLQIIPDYSGNTDGIVFGTMFEFKNEFGTETRKESIDEQCTRYYNKLNALAMNLPSKLLQISFNDKKFKLYSMSKYFLETEGTWTNPNDFKIFLSNEKYEKGWICKESITAYNLKYCLLSNKKTISKHDIINEFKNPHVLYINPFAYEHQIDQEKDTCKNDAWLTFNMNMLGSDDLKKRYGAFFTPDKYVIISTKMLRMEIEKINKSDDVQDYIIIDRCAGTGNLEKFLKEDELQHCVLNTLDYLERDTLIKLYDNRVRMILPSELSSLDKTTGMITDGDALSEKFYNFCFQPDKIRFIVSKDSYEKSLELNKWLTDPKIKIIMLENPPFRDNTSNQSKSTKQEKTFIEKQMIANKFTAQESREISNQFLWSAFNHFNISKYILFAPPTYVKVRNLIKANVDNSYLCNRLHFNASESSILLASLVPSENNLPEIIETKSDLEKTVIIKRCKSQISSLIKVDNTNDEVLGFFNTQLFKINELSGLLTNRTSDSHITFYRLTRENILYNLPLWVANCYVPKDYTEREVLYKSADGGRKYQEDCRFLRQCFIWSCITQKNKCFSGFQLKNELCLAQKTIAQEIFLKMETSDSDCVLYEQWLKILNLARLKSEFNKDWTYGFAQIEKEINIKIKSSTKDKSHILKDKFKYEDLNVECKKLKELLKKYFVTELESNLFKYELIK
ncbi:MAG: hypothetical protein LBU04_00990 [Christensenellaceae bacterium]|jgi:hypothetical protein|nr:hypothetical protein [Christensenellaceae bacterium]